MSIGTAEPMHQGVKLERASVTYGEGDDAFLALEETTLDIGPGEFVALVGPSGCGKSTILKLVAGLHPPGTGHVFAGGREVGAIPLRIGMAFQNATLLPWLSVRDNVMLPLKIVPPFKHEWRRKRRTVYRDRAEALLAQVGLSGYGDRSPWQLSGGMQQRASLCRALIHEPALMLLDEPFAALDQFTREELWDIVQKLWMERRPTVLMVTHDLREAAYLASRICVMRARPGRIVEDRTVEFPRPRSIAATYSPGFAAFTLQLREMIIEARMSSQATP